ncbi:rRNA small subunit 7-methylguanosine (m7G) methyltransferase GidB [Hydrogenimonas sp.]|nr:rRNA small subunit 7-methylguanosine (m7G) methyltransferase GidB [Hydrogenimonas sp.]
MKKSNEELLSGILRKSAAGTDRNPFEKLDLFRNRLMEWNRVHNLTGARTEEAIEEQIIDSAWPLGFLPSEDSLLDIGTGAGFPGMVLAILLPDTECTLCEPLQKRASFLRFIAGELELANVRVEAKRIEELEARPFSLITSRAVTGTHELIGWCRPFIGGSTQLLFYKGEHVHEEVAGLERCGIEIVGRKKRNYLWIKEASKC